MSVDLSAVNAAILAPTTEVFSRVDIYENDTTTPWRLNVPVIDGNVSIDHSRDERRTIDIELDNSNGQLRHCVGELWYDKVVKAYRGLRLLDGSVWETQIGEFRIDDITMRSFPHGISISGRDHVKTLLLAKFEHSTSFARGILIEELIRILLVNGGITKHILPSTGQSLDRDLLIDQNTSRWEVIKDLCIAAGYDAFFDGEGYFRMQPFQLPDQAPVRYTFKTGVDGNLVEYTKRSNDSRIKNVIIVSGESSDTASVYVVLRNDNPSSPTSTVNIGTRTESYQSSLVTNEDQALRIGTQMLATLGMESYEVAFDSVVFPWLDVGVAVRFEDPDPNPGEPDRFLLSSLNMPLKLGRMTGSMSRITIVG